MNNSAIDPRGTLAPAVHDELDRTATMLMARFPDRRRDEIASVVAHTYRRLAARARITTHLIPLTLNISRRVLAQHASGAGLTDVDGLPGCQVLDTAPALNFDRGCACRVGGDFGSAASDHKMQPVTAVP